eukprot:1457228-Pleurochrysis_carterae.AAC.1
MPKFPLRGLLCAGRLDADSTGLMLWTNDKGVCPDFQLRASSEQPKHAAVLCLAANSVCPDQHVLFLHASQFFRSGSSALKVTSRKNVIAARMLLPTVDSVCACACVCACMLVYLCGGV